MGFSVDGCQGVHQGFNLFSQFCFPTKFPTEFLLSREDPDCQGHRATVTLSYLVSSTERAVFSVCKSLHLQLVLFKLFSNTLNNTSYSHNRV